MKTTVGCLISLFWYWSILQTCYDQFMIQTSMKNVNICIAMCSKKQNGIRIQNGCPFINWKRIDPFNEIHHITNYEKTKVYICDWESNICNNSVRLKLVHSFSVFEIYNFCLQVLCLWWRNYNFPEMKYKEFFCVKFLRWNVFIMGNDTFLQSDNWHCGQVLISWSNFKFLWASFIIVPASSGPVIIFSIL